MKKIVILSMGETLKSISNKYGEFHDHIMNKGQLDKNQVVVVDCKKEEKIPDLDNIKGIIITGSHSMVSDYESWSVKICDYLKNIVNTNIPVLGICYGHQLLADMLGGQVGYNPKGMELGTVDIYLTDEGEKDKLLGVLPKNFKGHEAHSQSVLQIPKGAKILAYNEHDEVQSFSYDNHVWGTQFHPEFFSETTKEYLKFEKDKIIGIGKNYENIYNKIQKHKYGEMLLKRFIEIVEENNI